MGICKKCINSVRKKLEVTDHCDRCNGKMEKVNYDDPVGLMLEDNLLLLFFVLVIISVVLFFFKVI